MMTSVFAISGARNARLSKLVFPLPRKPVTMVTGIRLPARCDLAVSTVIEAQGSVVMAGLDPAIQ
jgi:hypothetical protein